MALCTCDEVKDANKEIVLFIPSRRVKFSFMKINGSIMPVGNESDDRREIRFSDMPKNIRSACYRMAGAIWNQKFKNKKQFKKPA